MPRLGIYLSEDIVKSLREYCAREWGNHYNLSAIIQKAIKEFLERQIEVRSINPRESS